tara:strand:- start:807 stop:1355 length:549 start_codon:yes stop_codon:yes gene_type:complete
MSVSNSKILLIILLIVIIFLRPILAILRDIKLISNKSYKTINTKMKPIEKFTNLTHFNDNNLKANISSIFKYNSNNFNLDSFPNIQLTPSNKFFKDNKFLPECCRYNSQYSSSSGCPCITPEQYYYLENRTNHMKDIKSNNTPVFSPTNELKKPNILLDNSTDYNNLDNDISINNINYTIIK